MVGGQFIDRFFRGGLPGRPFCFVAHFLVPVSGFDVPPFAAKFVCSHITATVNDFGNRPDCARLEPALNLG